MLKCYNTCAPLMTKFVPTPTSVCVCVYIRETLRARGYERQRKRKTERFWQCMCEWLLRLQEREELKKRENSLFW